MPKAAPRVGEQAVLEILRRHDARGDERGAEAGQDGALELGLDRLAVGLGLRRPVGAAGEVGTGEST